MNGEEILKDDPLNKPKKITVAAVVLMLAILMVLTFASFHWICVDYFSFRANEGDARKQLDELRARYVDEEAAANKRLEEVEEKVKVLEEDAQMRANAFESDAQKRILDAEQSSKGRIAALEKEYLDKHAAKLAEHQKLADELDESIKAKKNDIAILLRGYKERYDAKTNDFEQAIASKNVELLEIKRMISMLPDVKGQLLDASNALVAARAQRDTALKDYGEWSKKVEDVKAKVSGLDVRKNNLISELDSLVQNTNAVCLTMVSLQSQVKALQEKVTTTRMELQSVQDDVESTKANLEHVQRQASDAEKKRKAAESARVDAEADLSAALDKKREAESARDKAKSEAAQAEAHWAKRKLEIESLLKDMERILELKSQAVKAASEKKEEGVN